VVRYRAELRDRLDEVSTRLTEAQRAARQDEAERAKSLERIGRNEQIVVKTITELSAALAAVTAPRPTVDVA
jgi:hypothetical protein